MTTAAQNSTNTTATTTFIFTLTFTTSSTAPVPPSRQRKHNHLTHHTPHTQTPKVAPSTCRHADIDRQLAPALLCTPLGWKGALCGAGGPTAFCVFVALFIKVSFSTDKLTKESDYQTTHTDSQVHTVEPLLEPMEWSGFLYAYCAQLYPFIFLRVNIYLYTSLYTLDKVFFFGLI